MQGIVFDPGCQMVNSHHVALNLALKDECQARGMPFHCFYSHAAEPAAKEKLQGSPVLQSFFIYNRTDHPRFLFDEFSHVNRLVEEELDRHVMPIVQRGDILLAHTVAPSHLIGMVAWLKKRPELALKVRIIARFHPGHRIQEPETALMGAVWSYLLNTWGKIAAHHDVVFYADNEALATLYSQMGPLKFQITPIPIDFQFFHPNVLRIAPEPAHFFFMGDLRFEKGGQILLDALHHHATRHPEGRYTVQLTGKTEVRLSAELQQRIRFIQGALLPKDYYALLGEADVVLVPYDPKEYTYRTSHIFVEALGFGKPVVTIAKTWMDQALLPFAAEMPATVASSFDPTSLAQAMSEMSQHHLRYAAAALKQASFWRETHNIKSFINCLLGKNAP